LLGTTVRSKSGELINSLEVGDINGHVLCCSEHHMEEQEGPAAPHITRMCVRVTFLQRGGVFVFVREDDCITAKSILHVTGKTRIWKFVPLNWRLNHLN
jgi:hypothetical protein